MASAGDRAASHQAILAQLVRGFAAASGCLALTEPDGRSLRIVAGLKLPPGVVGSLVDFGDRILGWVAANAEPVQLNGDISKDTRFRNLTARSASGVPMVAMCLPLQVEGRVVGVMSLNREQGAAPFTPRDLEHATRIADLVAIVVENAALHEEERRRIAELSELNRKLEQAQGQLLQSEKMASIGQLAAGVAHEINNPLGFIRSNLNTAAGYVQQIARIGAVVRTAPDPKRLAAAWQDERLDAVIEDFPILLQESIDAVERVAKIVAALKDFSSIDRAEETVADVNALIRNTCQVAASEFSERVRLVTDFAPLPALRCHAGRLSQAFLNLLRNAVQAISGTGEVRIATRADRQAITVTVTDTGYGKPPEVQARIFDPFFTTREVGRGSGQGRRR